MRIVSLIASATEIVCSLDMREALVGRSHECDNPTDITSLPALTTTKLDKNLSSAAIDTAVKSLVGDGLAVYQVNEKRLRALAPDVILTQDQCEVCAASLQDVEAAVCDWVGRDVKIVSLHPNSLDDIWRDIQIVGDTLECGVKASTLISTAQAHLKQSRAAAPADTPSVLIVEWVDPLMSAGHWIPELVTAAGGIPLLAKAGGPSPYITLSDIATADPDVIIVAPCGFGIERTAKDMRVLENEQAWLGLRAVQEGRVAIADGNLFFNRPSLSVVKTVDIIKDVLENVRKDGVHEPQCSKTEWQFWNPNT